MESDQELVAYVAGLLDGEGCISITTRSGGHWPSVGLEIAREAITAVVTRFGGTVQIRKRQNPKAAVQATVNWRSNAATKPLLEAVLPYIRVKREQAEIVLSMIRYDEENPTVKHGGGMAWTPERTAAWAAAKMRIHDLNQTGPQVPPPNYIAEFVGSRWITRKVDLFGERWETFSGPWPRSGMTVRGRAYELPPLELHTAASESSSWPTPDAAAMNSGAVDVPKMEARRERAKQTSTAGNGFGLTLGTAAALWPTPTGQDQKASGAAEYSTESGRHSGTTLTDAAQRQFLSSPQRRVIQPDGSPLSPTTRILRPRLNPMFVCWLMGSPTWWTRPEPISCAAPEMESYRCKLLWLLDYYCGD